MAEFNEARHLNPADERFDLIGLIKDNAREQIGAAAVHVSDQWVSNVILVGNVADFDDSDPMSVYNGGEVRQIVSTSFDGTRRMGRLVVSASGGSIRGYFALTQGAEQQGLTKESAVHDMTLHRILARTVFYWDRAKDYRDRLVELEALMGPPDEIEPDEVAA